MILGILQARMSSSRLPGKILLPLSGAPMLQRQIERLARSKTIHRLIVATSDEAADDPVEQLATQAGVGCYRGSLEDVLDRYYRAAEPYSPDHVVRVTGDCPLIDWKTADDVVRFAVAGGFDYASNTLNPTFPDGLDVEVATFSALEVAWREAADKIEREHVMPFITARPKRFKLGSHQQPEDLSNLRWTVDEPRDYDFVSRIYDALYPHDPAFTTAAILRLLRREPDLLELNSGIERNEGLKKAKAMLMKDAQND
jgi:spore coat polysaccharide biosynthesis protein SpsF